MIQDEEEKGRQQGGLLLVVLRCPAEAGGQEDRVAGGLVALRVQHLRQPQRAADPQVQFHWKATGVFSQGFFVSFKGI